ncbi:MAG: Wzz/FepE/Etk N-terminal domain-containing protein [Liquorilactobacillus nagelii]|uniref:Capsular polysaccharide biosynthesis protein CpsC n=1 Tax=Liquorilactobacillus nagelii TaxID=82688 RepID=A0A3Q8CC40_9LACO|nr:Wzz/FepE/Etk N-terminal domain-containing protein [Liquorilactobacillus nagelii]AUJ32056.1 chain-length determining protein [Liquorilactobacillus nagelii]MCC7615210.1 chain-length determining protein [Liquorilactobacillus nagelii]MCP9314872.1 chain-length determining protein [Liquorilactobacillus nagelii]
MSEETNNETVIDLRQLGALLWKNIWGILIWGILGIILALGISFVFMTPKYSATIDLLVNQKVDNSALQYNAQQADLQAINTYKDVLTKPVILTPVLKQVKQQDNYTGSLSSLENSISITNETNSQVISVTVTDTNAYTAADLANTIGKVFSSKIKKMMKINNVTVVTEAKADTTPVSPKIKLNILIGFVLGLLVGIALIVIRDLLDTTVRDEKFLTDELGMTSLGFISHISSHTKRHAVNVVVSEDSHFSRRRV